MWVKFEKRIVKKDKYHSAPSQLVTLRSWPDKTSTGMYLGYTVKGNSKINYVNPWHYLSIAWDTQPLCHFMYVG